jgi:hypothetical protein
MSNNNPNAGVCALTGAENACVFVEPDGTLEGAFGSKHDTVRFVWLDGQPETLAAGNKLCDAAVDQLLAEGKIEAFDSHINGPMPVTPAAFRAAFAIERQHAAKLISQMLSGALTARQALSALLDTGSVPDAFSLALLDVLVETAGLTAPGAGEWLEPWLVQRRLRNTVLAALQADSQPEDDNSPIQGSPLKIVDCQ